MNSFIYPGKSKTHNDNDDPEIFERISLAWESFHKYRILFRASVNFEETMDKCCPAGFNLCFMVLDTNS